MSLESQKSLKKSAKIGITWTVLILIFSVASGCVGHLLMGELADSSTVFIQMVRFMFPALISGILLSAILAAAMSTADSQLLSAASAFSENLVQDTLGIKLTAKQNMLVARATVVVIAVIATFLATDPNSSVFKIVSFAWAGFGATFGPAVLFALFWKRSNRQGILAGLIAGGAMVFIWKFGISKLGGAFAIYELLPAFVVASIAIVVVSLMTPAPEQELIDVFDEVNSK
jgi:sodium/proline symporter